MDLALYFRVIWRFRYLALAGVVLAFMLAFFSYAKVSLAGITYRGSETWEASETLMITEPGFPIGRSGSTTVVSPTSTADTASSPTDTLRFASLAPVYAQLATSDATTRLARKQGPLPGSFTASPVAFRRQGARQLPFITITGTAATPASAVEVARRASAALVVFVERRQAAAGIAKKNRTVIEIVNEAKGATKVKGRNLTVPIVIFLTVAIATLALAFILENLRPRGTPRALASEDERDEVRAVSRGG